MRRLSFPLRSVLPIAALLLVPLPSRAEEGEKIAFETADKITLRGTFYPSAKKGNQSPCVLLINKLGAERDRPGWESLAKALQAKGFAVLSYDARGVGSSDTVKQEFWKYPGNNARNIIGGNPQKQTIEFKNFSPSYYPMMVNDITAAKYALEQKNNAKDCNVGDLILIAEGDGAALASLWIASEWKRRKLVPNMAGVMVPGSDPEGRDIAAAVFLSPRLAFGSGTKTRAAYVQNWLTSDKHIRDKIGFYSVYGNGDNAGKQAAESIYGWLGGKACPCKYTFKPGVEDAKLVGQDLIKKDLGTEKRIVAYIEDKVMATRNSTVWSEREFKGPNAPQVIPLSQFGVPVQ
jgi:pimeloyl-ACP methyl ester carboxylesterase